MNKNLAADLEDLTFDEKRALLETLLKEHLPALPVPLGDAAHGLLIFNGLVPEGSMAVTLQVASQHLFRPRRLLILEPVGEVVEREEHVVETPRLVDETVGMWWWKKTAKVQRGTTIERTSREHRREKSVPRGLWDILAVFFGHIPALPVMRGSLEGDLFGPDGTVDFGGKLVEPSLMVTLQLRHRAVGQLPFSAVMLGEIVKEMEGGHDLMLGESTRSSAAG